MWISVNGTPILKKLAPKPLELASTPQKFAVRFSLCRVQMDEKSRNSPVPNNGYTRVIEAEILKSSILEEKDPSPCFNLYPMIE